MARIRHRPCSIRGAPRADRGFTLVEAMVTVTILGLLAMVAVPSFNNAMLGNKLSSFSNTFVANVQLARSEAIKRNATITMCRSSTGTSCADSGGWQQGWILFNEKNANGTVDADETRIHYQQKLANDFQLTGDNYTIVFQPTGLSSTSANLRLCRVTPAGSQERTLVLGTTGRVTVTKTTTGSCA